MRSKLIAVAIATGLGVSSFTVAAAAPVKHKHKKVQTQAQVADSSASTNAEVEALKAQLAQLQAQVAALEQRTDAQSDINVSTGQAVETVQKAQVASDAKVSTIDKFVSNTKVSGTMFFDMTDTDHKEQTGTGSSVKKDGHGSVNGIGYDVKRFYLAVDHKFNDIWSANLTTDFNYVSTDSETQLFVKKAYLQGTFDPMFTVRFGAADMPWIPFVEKWYGYRFLENTITDRSIDGGRGTAGTAATGVGSFGNSSDWGIHALGGTPGDNSLNYQVSVVNGGGYKNPTRSNGMDVEARLGYQPIKEMVIAVGGYDGKRGKDVQNGAPTQDTKRGDALVAFRNDTFGIGAEYFTAKNWDDVLKYAGALPAPVAIRDKADGYSAFADWTFVPQWALFARYDSVDYRYWGVSDVQNKLKDTYYNAGISYDVLKNLRLALAWKYDKLAGPVASPFTFKTNEIGFWGVLTY
ncbi:carbohydrate porin [Rhodanobacter sp. L36]|uniref:carbohydrate porin n=1 Tax=Rhodanobacter sp. L36 TaxID=1747221 RepID=UPI00131CA5C0|nr:carbohydrate porin [Rhodanobacter sp. L36]